ncbi:MAG: BatA domain-containing protein [Flavobacteriales bacterium]
MQFLYPGILYALAAISIPILVHLFNFRRFKKVQFSNVEYLKEIKQETKSKSKIKHFLILCARVLALAAIVLAFAQPFMPTGDNGAKTGKKTVGVYIDNSFSMESESESGSILEIAKNKALEVVKYHSPTDVFQLITNDFEGRHQRWLTQEEISELITEIDVSPQSRTLSEVYARHKDLSLKEEADQRMVYVLSDLQKSVTDIENIQPDSLFSLQFLPTPSAFTENLFIDSVWFSSPSRNLNSLENLHVRVKNTLQRRKENIPLRLYINGIQKSVISINADPGVETDTVLTFTNSSSGFKQAKVQVEDYPVTFDDEFFFGYEVAEKANILEITSGNKKVFSNLFKNTKEYNFSKFTAKQIDYNRFSEFDLVIVNQLSFISGGLKQELDKFSNAGGTVVVIPAINADLSSYNSYFTLREADLFTALKNLDTKVSNLNFDHLVYKDVFDAENRNMPLPKVNSYFETTNSNRRNRDELATLQNGAAFISHFQKNNASLYVFNTSLEGAQTDLASHALLVYTMHSIANHAKTSTKTFFELGEEKAFSLKSANSGDANSVVKMKSAEGYEFIPEFRRKNGLFEIFPGSDARVSGNYAVNSNDNQIGAIGINYNRKESEIIYYDAYDLKQELRKQALTSSNVITSDMNTIGASIQEVNEGKTLWKSFIMLALLFLGIEIILIKFWK